MGDDAPVAVRAAPQPVAGEVRVPIPIQPGVEGLMTGASWQAGAPTLTLIAPNGTEVTQANAASFGAEFQVMPSSTLVGVKNPATGGWQIKLSGLSAEGVEHYKLMAFTNKGAPVKPGQNPFTAPASANEDGTNSSKIAWNVPPGTSDSATVSLFYTRTNGTRARQPRPGRADRTEPAVQGGRLHLGYARAGERYVPGVRRRR